MDPATQARHELLQRLEFFRLEPRVILDVGSGSGAGAAALRKRFARARVVAVDRAYAMAQQARRGQRFWRRFDCVCAEGAALPFAAQSADLVFCSLLQPDGDDAGTLFAELQRVLRPAGLLLFATLAADMLQLGAALGHAGFVEPVLDRDREAGLDFVYGAAFAGRGDRSARSADGHVGESVVPLSAVRTRPGSVS